MPHVCANKVSSNMPFGCECQWFELKKIKKDCSCGSLLSHHFEREDGTIGKRRSHDLDCDALVSGIRVICANCEQTKDLYNK